MVAVPHPELGRALVLRDSQGLSETQVMIPLGLLPVLQRFSGRLSCADIANEFSNETGTHVPVEAIVRLAQELERGLFLDGPAFRSARARALREFDEAGVRAATHAGGAYPGDPRALDLYIEEACLAKARVAPPTGRPGDPRLIGLIAPHIDPWRGAVGYGHAYKAMHEALPPEADTFIVLGTSHAPMREPFALCRKAFDTPLGPVPADTVSLDALAEQADGFDPYADQFNHKREHSLEFQVVFLKHLLKRRAFRIVPVLAGLGSFQASGEDPATDTRIVGFIRAIRALVDARPGRVVVVAGADLAHVGPRFGDPRPFDSSQRRELENRDRASLDRATALDGPASGLTSQPISTNAAFADSRRSGRC